MPLAVTLTSILALTGLTWLVNRSGIFRAPSGGKISLCPICTGTSLTWISLVAARFAGYPVEPELIGVLAGGSAVGIAYVLERRLPPARSALAWKIVAVVSGFAAAYGIAVEQWLTAAGGIVVFAAACLLFFALPQKTAAENKRISELEKKMKQCC